LVRTTKEESQSLPGGDSRTIRVVSAPDSDGRLQPTRREICETKKISRDVQETKTTVMLPSITGELSPATRTGRGGHANSSGSERRPASLKCLLWTLQNQTTFTPFSFRCRLLPADVVAIELCLGSATRRQRPLRNLRCVASAARPIALRLPPGFSPTNGLFFSQLTMRYLGVHSSQKEVTP
jgi:hypothetical protein